MAIRKFGLNNCKL